LAVNSTRYFAMRASDRSSWLHLKESTPGMNGHENSISWGY